jgi:hypothetical protein
VDHQQPAGGEGAEAARLRETGGEEAGQRDAGDDGAGRAVVASLTEQPQPVTHRVILDRLVRSAVGWGVHGAMACSRRFIRCAPYRQDGERT